MMHTGSKDTYVASLLADICIFTTLTNMRKERFFEEKSADSECLKNCEAIRMHHKEMKCNNAWRNVE